MITTIKDNNESVAIWQPEKAIARLGGEIIITKLAELFVRDSPLLMGTVKSGINQKSYDDAFTALHSLQGTSANFYTPKFETACAQIQHELKNDNWEEAGMNFNKLEQYYTELDKELRVFISNGNG